MLKYRHTAREKYARHRRNFFWVFALHFGTRQFGCPSTEWRPALLTFLWGIDMLRKLLIVSAAAFLLGACASEPPPPPPPPPPAPAQTQAFMVFFDWDRSNLSPQALNTVQQAADAYKTRGSAQITATGHTDTSGPENYNMALSLRRANTVKNALVQDGVPAQAINVVGVGEAGLLVQTGDGVREPQNRRVEIVIGGGQVVRVSFRTPGPTVRP